MNENIVKNQFLENMGIQNWALSHPSRLSGYQQATIDIPESCSLLFISPVKPEGEMVVMFGNVLKSLKLTINQARHIFPEQLAMIGCHQLSWLWFSGCEKWDIPKIKLLETPLLSDINGNNQERRRLWQQICSYEQQ